MTLDISEVARMAGASVAKMPARRVSLLLTDSRSLTDPNGTLFFAIRTGGNDGHNYISDLYGRGVRLFVVNDDYRDEGRYPDAVFLRVDDTQHALLRIGSGVRERSRARVVAVTGSRGKTAVKEWLYQAMAPLKETVRSPRSYNSRIGVPLSLWQLEASSQLAIIEAGVSQRGEMRVLRDIIRPEVVVITNLGAEHDEGFASRAEKAAEKLSLAEGSKLLIYCADDTLVAEEARRKNVPTFVWSRRDPAADLFVEKETPEGDKTLAECIFQGEKLKLTIPATEGYEIDNALTVFAFMLAEGYDPALASQRIAILKKTGTRLDVTEGVNDCLIISDSYTNDMPSLTQALDFARRRSSHKPVTLVLSDLADSPQGESWIDETVELLEQTGVRRLIGVGPQLEVHSERFPSNSRFFPSTEALLQAMSPSDFVGENILVKGAPEFGFHRLVERLEARKHETVLEVNLDSIVDNYNYFRRQLPTSCGLIAMVKASGYGAGSYEVAKTMQDHGAAYLAVAVLDEGIELRNRGIDMPIMVMNPKVVNYKSMFAYSLEPEIYSFEMLNDVIQETEKSQIKGYPVHIKLDTGMHRMGFVGEELPHLMDILEAHPGVEVRSVFSHLATADCLDMDDYTHLQLSRFQEWTEYMLSRSPKPFLRHILNSAGIMRFPEHHYDMARLGIGLYGVNTLPPEVERPLSVVSSLRTVIIAIRDWKAGETVGYGRRGVLKRDSRIATIPVGYADGMNRHFGCGAVSVLVNGHECPTVGNICMDACMIDVTDAHCKVGDTVEVFGPNAPIQRLADTLGTIPYEVLTSVSPRVKRVYYRE